MSPNVASKCFALVNGYDVKPRRRLFETLRWQGLQMNQALIFLSDGGDTVRDLQFYLSPQSEHLLDWFHITIRITVMQQMVKGLPFPALLGKFELDPAHEPGRIRWFLWHGNIFKALHTIQFLEGALEALPAEGQFTDLSKLLRTYMNFTGTSESTNALGFAWSLRMVLCKSLSSNLQSPISLNYNEAARTHSTMPDQWVTYGR